MRGIDAGRTILVIALTVLLHADPADAWQQTAMKAMPGMTSAKSSSGEACDDLSGLGGMSVMGESMGAMTNHMCITPMRPKQAGDEERAKALIRAGKGYD